MKLAVGNAFLLRAFSGIAVFCLFLQFTTVPGAHAQNVRTIFFVRHADKASDEIDAPLSEAGRQRAACLANMLSDAHIEQIFTSDLQRTQQTAAPLAEKLHLEPIAIPLSQPNRLIDAVRASKAAIVLVVWHDQTLPKILLALGAPEIAPIAHTEYDRFFILTLPTGKVHSPTNLITLRYCDPQK